MKTFFAVLAALLCVFFVGRAVINQDRQMEKWQQAKNYCAAEIQSSFARSDEISKFPGVTSDELTHNLTRLNKEYAFREEMFRNLQDILEHKPSPLTPRERKELEDTKEALAIEKPKAQ
jgi:hypothetical protein